MKIEDLKSCANCNDSVFQDEDFCDERIGYIIINRACNINDYSCINYSSWKYDGLTQKERAMQEIV